MVRKGGGVHLLEVNCRVKPCSKVVLKLKCKKNSRSVGVLFKTNVLFTTHIHKCWPKVDATKAAMWCTGPLHRLPFHGNIL